MDGIAPLVLLIEDEPQMRRFLRTALGANDYRLVEAATAQGRSRAGRRAGTPTSSCSTSACPTATAWKWPRSSAGGARPRSSSSRRAAASRTRWPRWTSAPTTTSPSRSASEELLARIRVALRHAAMPAGAVPEPVFESGDLKVDLPARRVWRAGEEVHLTPTEYKLLAVMVRNAGKVLTHRQLLKEVWGISYVSQAHYVRVYLAQLRQKIEADPARPRLLLTEPGVGYRLRDE